VKVTVGVKVRVKREVKVKGEAKGLPGTRKAVRRKSGKWRNRKA
jgi:hypothetical protein